MSEPFVSRGVNEFSTSVPQSPLTDEVLAGMFEIVERFKDNICEHKIFRGIKW
jgi:hypothetical protein